MKGEHGCVLMCVVDSKLTPNIPERLISSARMMELFSMSDSFILPYHPWDWYIYLHLVDFYGKCRYCKYTMHGSCGFFHTGLSLSVSRSREAGRT